MEALTIGSALVGSFATAFWLQKATLEAVFKALELGRRSRE